MEPATTVPLYPQCRNTTRLTETACGLVAPVAGPPTATAWPGSMSAGVEEELGQGVMHPVDEEVLRAAQVDLRDLTQRKPSGGRQQAAHVQIEAAGWRTRGLGHVGDLAVGVEAVLRQDGNFVRIDGRVGFIEYAGDAHDAAGGERADALAVVPLGISGYVDGELAAMRALHDEGLGGDIDADDGGIELIDVGAGVAGADRADVEGWGDRRR